LKPYELLHADCIAAMSLVIEPGSVDAIVTDPPYELGFMGKGWDSTGIANNPAMWRAAFDCLKPGGHLLAFSGTRTYHRMVCAIEDAGFEIRDQIGWAYGSGFPKSLDVSKAIDKAGGASPKEQATILRVKREAAGLSREAVAEHVGCTVSSVRDWEEGRARAEGAAVEFIVPRDDYRAKLADLLGYSADERRLIGAASDRRGDASIYGIGHSGELRTGGNTDAALEWQGWGTALKPAWEPICVARKPLTGTVAANVLAHGTGALNIDGCRVAHWGGDPSVQDYASTVSPPRGRWPANLVHDGSDEVLAAFPQAKGQQGGVTGDEPSAKTANAFGEFAGGDTGSAARFFYCAKASKSDRGEGNVHPTVKPTELMRYLCRLITPPGGVVLDPFTGSGSTGKAAVLEGFRFVGCELSDEYVRIAEARIAHAWTSTIKAAA
jgi:site-specific DNA-methyltransferase (adenine-specific)